MCRLLQFYCSKFFKKKFYSLFASASSTLTQSIIERWQITEVEFKHGSDGFKSSYLVHYKHKNTGEKENTFLPWLLSSEKYSEVRKEEWFKEEYKKLVDPKYRDETYEETFRGGDIVKA